MCGVIFVYIQFGSPQIEVEGGVVMLGGLGDFDDVHTKIENARIVR